MKTKISASALLILAASLIILAGCNNNATPAPSSTYDVVDALNTKLFAVDDITLYSTISQKVGDKDLSLSILDGYDFMLLSENGQSGKLAIYSFSQSNAEKAVSMGNAKAAEWIGYVKSIELSTYAADTDAAARNGIYIRALISIFTPGSEEFVEDALGIYGSPSGNASKVESGLEITVDKVTYSYFPENVSFCIAPSNSSIPSAIRPE